MENQTFTISVFRNNVGLLNRISGIFLKRHINILSLNVSESEIENVSVYYCSAYHWKMGAEYCRSNWKQIEVIKAFLSYMMKLFSNAFVQNRISLLFDEKQIQT
jgi:acetolactate synthase-1/3 small subunit